MFVCKSLRKEKSIPRSGTGSPVLSHINKEPHYGEVLGLIKWLNCSVMMSRALVFFFFSFAVILSVLVSAP